MSIYTYTPDMMRPECPVCGRYVQQTTDTPEIEWLGTCPNGHQHTFQLEEYEEEEEENDG